MNNTSVVDKRKKAGVLIVDDNPADRLLFGEWVDTQATYSEGNLLEASTCDEAEKILEKYKPSCCLIDYRMPGSDGVEFIKAIRLQDDNRNIPIIMMTGKGNEKVAVDIMRGGAQDYLIKGEMTAELLNHSIKTAIKTCDLQGQLQYLAHYDTLTGLLNRALFLDRLQSAVDKCDRYKHSCSVLYIDVDDFKKINDGYGHYTGDEVLKEIAKRMKANCRNTDSPARLGGDEFAILLDCIDEENVYRTAEKILKAVSVPVNVDGNTVRVSVSIGVVCYPKTAKDMHDLLKQADEAMYQAKQSGKAGYSYFTDAHREKWERIKQLEIMLPIAIRNNDLSLAYQPIVKASDQSLYGLEVLARWSPHGFDVSAQELVNMVERLGLFDYFHTWLMNTALCQCAQWDALGNEMQYCINIPANHAHSEWLVHALHKALKTYGMNPFQISLEITETTLMDSPKPASDLLALLQGEGVNISLEDFGTGRSSMSYITSLPLSVLKIDHQFVMGIGQNKANRKVVEAITALGHSLGLHVVAEGVETEEEYFILREIGCDLMQGFYFGKPKVAVDIWDDFVSQYSQPSSEKSSEAPAVLARSVKHKNTPSL
ncbi:MAG: diguanylate cyclase (GGDEF)-like protein [Candidatus Endobugula sp.]|jgi:diguanylate cyclase (GGDEF)-like protein